MLDQLISLFDENERFVLTTHRRPDADAVGSQLALGRFLEKLGKQVTMINADPLVHSLSWLPGARAVEVYDGSVQQHESIGLADVAVVLDTNAEERLGKVGRLFRHSSAVKVLIDHHTAPESWFDLVYRRELASSTGQLVYEIITAYDPDLIDAEIASALYAAVMTDTGSFRYSNVTPAVHRLIGDLLERGEIEPDDIHAAVYDTRTLQGLRLMGRTLGSTTLRFDGLLGYMVVTQRMLDETGADRDDTEGFVNYALSIEGVQVAVIFIESEPGVKVSFRSKGDHHVHTWAQAFGGGGHRNASGAYVRGDLREVIDRVLTAAPRHLGLEAEPEAGEQVILTGEDADYLALLNQKSNKNRR
jgi:phosphoesterase RecJ-like protein